MGEAAFLDASESNYVSGHGSVLSENPLWHRDMLFWTDVNACQLHCFANGRDHRIWSFDVPVIAIKPTVDDDRLLLILAHSVLLFDLPSGRLSPCLFSAPWWPSRRFNDAAINAAGRL